MSNELLHKASEWFISVKAPDLENKVKNGLLSINNGEVLLDHYKKLFGFILFDYAMHHGGSTFFGVEKTAKEINVTEELKYYANDWINSNKNISSKPTK